MSVGASHLDSPLLPTDRAILRALWKETTEQRIRFYQSFLNDRLGKRSVDSLVASVGSSPNDWDGEACRRKKLKTGEVIRRKIREANNKGSAAPGFEISSQTHLNPEKNRARPGIQGLVEQYLSYDQRCALEMGYEEIREARHSLDRLAEHGTDGLLDGWLALLERKNSGVLHIIGAYEELATTIKSKLDARGEPKDAQFASGPAIVKLANESRDKWLYTQCCRLVPYKTIIIRLNKRPNWEPLATTNGVKRAANSYAATHRLSPIPKRQRGRKAR